MKPEIAIVAAMGENRVIGKDNNLPWNIPEDLKRFRTLTLGHPVIMGRRTFESIGRPLPKRSNFVISRNPRFEIEGIVHCGSLGEALSRAGESGKKKVFIIGGGQIYRQAINVADRLFLTVVRGEFKGDVFFPDYSEFQEKVFEKSGQSNGYDFTFLELER